MPLCLCVCGERPIRGGATIRFVIAATKVPAGKPRWYLIPVRVLLVTFLLTLLAFAVSLLLGILGMLTAGRLQGVHPNMTLAYRHIALPAAAVVGAVVLISASILEVRHYRQTKTLAGIERMSRARSA